MEKLKEIFRKMKRFYKTKYGRATFFFGFYFIFFILMGLVLGGSNNRNNSDFVDDNHELYKTSHLINTNYYYNYIVVMDDKELLFSGRSDLENNLVNSFQYNYFFNLANVKQIIKNSKYISKTEYTDKNIELNYIIKTSELIELLDEDINITEDNTNNIKVIMNSDQEVKSFVLNISDYMHYHNELVNNCEITLNYDLLKENEGENEKSNTN